MRNILFAIAAMAILTGCSQTEKGAVIGGLGGAAVGGAISGDAGGAIVGGALGATAGALIGSANEPGRCYYRDSRGRRYVARCPAGY
ncbi:MAG: glycine zipper domain-containing protein [Pseudaminobacter sp.]